MKVREKELKYRIFQEKAKISKNSRKRAKILKFLKKRAKNLNC